MKEMRSKLVFITGASSGIGQACAILLAKQGYNLILAARRLDKLLTLKSELENNYNVQVHTIKLDVRNRQDVEEAIANLPEDWQNINALINNAGLALGLSTIDNGNVDHWDTMIDTNVKGLLYVTKSILPFMLSQKGGHIINIGSIAGKEVYANGNVYCATKHAVDAITKSLRLDLSTIPIRVSAVNPGAVETEFSIVRFEQDIERAKAVYKGYENLVANDIAEAVWFIMSRPENVNINELTIMPTAQPMAGVINRKI